MDFYYSSDKWKDVLGADFAETICVPPCLDVLKIWKRNDLDESPRLAPNISGQKGEAAFMLKFQELNMGGILVSGLQFHELEACRAVPKTIFQYGEWDAIFFHQVRGIYVIEVKATETNDDNIVKKQIEKAKNQLDRNIKSIQQIFISLYHEECTCITGFICFPLRNEDRKTYDIYEVIDKSGLNGHAIFRKFFEPRKNSTMIEVSLLQRFVAEFVCCRSQVEFHSQAYNAMQIATWVMEQDISQKQDPAKVANMPGNGPSGKIILTAQQLEIVECREKCVTIRGAPGSGKTLILMLRALKAVMENKLGSVFVFVNKELRAKYKNYFFEEIDKKFVENAKNTVRRPKVLTIDKIKFVKPEDDVFFDETPVEESYIEKMESRVNCRGTTTVVFTGLHKPDEADDSFDLYEPRLEQFQHFKLMKVLRGTGNIFGKWEHYYPLGITMGHNIDGVVVKSYNFDSFEQVQNEIANKITTLTSTNISNTDLPSLKKEHIAVITCDDNDSTEIKNYFETKEIPCGQVNEQARKSSSIVAVDVYLNTPSYEWPVVFIVLKPGVTKEEVMPIAASRCIASLTIITYKKGLIAYKNKHSYNPVSSLGKIIATVSSIKADGLNPTEEEIFEESYQTSPTSSPCSSQSNNEDWHKMLETQTPSRSPSTTSQSYQEAVKWYTKSAEQGYLNAQYRLGLKYENGKGVSQSGIEVVKWYRKSAEQGNANTHYRLGLKYSNGDSVPQSHQEAVKWYRKSAEQGNANAQLNLGNMYNNGDGVPQSGKEAAQWYRKSAEQGNANAQYQLGLVHDNGHGVRQSDQEAVTWYRKSAEQGNLNAQLKLARMYRYGRGVPQSNEDAVKWYMKSAKQGNADAQYFLAWMYKNGKGVPQSNEEAVKWYTKSAEQGDADAQNNLGLMYDNGDGVRQSGKEAVKWYRKSAEQGNADAQNNLGQMYENGDGVPQSDQEAVKWYRKSAEQGNADAQNNLGQMYDNGDGVRQSGKEAVKWYRKSAEQGNADAQNNLGQMYDNGDGVRQSGKEAVKWYRKSAEQGNADAQNNLGQMYDNGDGVPQSHQEAVKWYRKSAEQGNANAQNNLGLMYDNGDGVRQSGKEAVKWYRKSAEQGNADAQNNLGQMYDNGDGVRQSGKEAVKWYRKSAELGNGDAQLNLGNMYRNGQGVRQSNQEAVKWYRKSAEQGNRNAKYQLGVMQKKRR